MFSPLFVVLNDAIVIRFKVLSEVQPTLRISVSFTTCVAGYNYYNYGMIPGYPLRLRPQTQDRQVVTVTLTVSRLKSRGVCRLSMSAAVDVGRPAFDMLLPSLFNCSVNV